MITATDNTFYGQGTGVNCTASFNSLYGSYAGSGITTGSSKNDIFGYNTAGSSHTCTINSIFGTGCLISNTTAFTGNALLAYITLELVL